MALLSLGPAIENIRNYKVIIQPTTFLFLQFKMLAFERQSYNPQPSYLKGRSRTCATYQCMSVRPAGTWVRGRPRSARFPGTCGRRRSWIFETWRKPAPRFQQTWWSWFQTEPEIKKIIKNIWRWRCPSWNNIYCRKYLFFWTDLTSPGSANPFSHVPSYPWLPMCCGLSPSCWHPCPERTSWSSGRRTPPRFPPWPPGSSGSRRSAGCPTSTSGPSCQSRSSESCCNDRTNKNMFTFISHTIWALSNRSRLHKDDERWDNVQTHEEEGGHEDGGDADAEGEDGLVPHGEVLLIVHVEDGVGEDGHYLRGRRYKSLWAVPELCSMPVTHLVICKIPVDGVADGKGQIPGPSVGLGEVPRRLEDGVVGHEAAGSDIVFGGVHVRAGRRVVGALVQPEGVGVSSFPYIKQHSYWCSFY